MTPTVEPKALDVRREIENAVSVACDSDHDATGWFEPGYGDGKSTYDRHITPVVDLIASHIDTLKQQREAAERSAESFYGDAVGWELQAHTLRRELVDANHFNETLRERSLGIEAERDALRTRLAEKAADAGIDDLLRRLDAIARQSYDYGLPIGADDPENERLRETVRAWLREGT